MKFISTRNSETSMSFSQAVSCGLAPDGGLFVPEEIPLVDWQTLEEVSKFSDVAEQVLKPYFVGDPLESSLGDICKEAFNFPVPLKSLKDDTFVLELFHGPTCAFKDFGARFLAACFKRLDGPKKTIFVATSGDTGGAVAAAFYKNSAVDVGVLFPKGKVSKRQEKQLTCWGENIKSFSVQGDFDSCQKIVKSAFMDEIWRKEKNLTSANSINIGRLLPQMTYYAASSIQYFKARGQKPSYIIPSGNLGNAVAAFYAKKMGFPIKKIALATNANNTIPEYFASGVYKPYESVSTLANAMDVGNPSNMERLLYLYKNIEDLKEDSKSLSVSDEQIKETIRRGEEEWGEIWCPHTATAVFMREQIKEPHWIIVSTAHPAKFESVVEPLINHSILMPSTLKELLEKPSSFKEIEPTLNSLKKAFSL